MPSFELVVDVLDTAAADGHTALPESVLTAILAGHGGTAGAASAAIEAAHDSGEVVSTPDNTHGRLFSRAGIAAAEQAVAEAVTGLTAMDALMVVDAPAGAARQAAAELRDTGVHVIADAHDLDVTAAAVALGEVPAEAPVALVGDGGLPPPAGPGRVFADLLSAAATLDIPVERHDAGDGDPVSALCARIRAGELPPIPDEPSRRVVVVPAADGVAATRRACQLVTDSIPRVFGLTGEEIGVLSPLRRGPAGTEALRATALPVHPLREARGRHWPAVVAVLPPESCGLLSRPLVYAMFRAASVHLSVVHAVGPTLARAVRTVDVRPRRTRLAGLLSASSLEVVS